MTADSAVAAIFRGGRQKVRIRITDPDGPARPNKGHPTTIAGTDYYHGDRVTVSAELADRLIRFGQAKLAAKGDVEVVIQDPFGEPKPRRFGVSIDGQRREAGEVVKVDVATAQDMVRERRAEWVDGPPPRDDED